MTDAQTEMFHSPMARRIDDFLVADALNAIATEQPTAQQLQDRGDELAKALTECKHLIEQLHVGLWCADAAFTELEGAGPPYLQLVSDSCSEAIRDARDALKVSQG